MVLEETGKGGAVGGPVGCLFTWRFGVGWRWVIGGFWYLGLAGLEPGAAVIEKKLLLIRWGFRGCCVQGVVLEMCISGGVRCMIWLDCRCVCLYSFL